MFRIFLAITSMTFGAPSCSAGGYFASSAVKFNGVEFPFTILTNNSAINRNAPIITNIIETHPSLHLLVR